MEAVEKELISIIIPVYKVESFLKKCIESVISQTYKNLEIILVDDGSPDSCGDICDFFAAKDSRIKVIHKENGGLCAARNAGLKIASGSFIGFVDSDDWCAPEMYEVLHRLLKENQADVSCCAYFRVKEGEEIISRCDGKLSVYETHDLVKETVGKFNIRTTFWNKLFKKELFEGLEFPEGRTYEGAILMHKVLSKAKKGVYLSMPYYYYVDVKGSIVNTRDVKNCCSYVQAHVDRYSEMIDDYPELKRALMDQAVNSFRSLSYSCAKISKLDYDQYKDVLKKVGAFINEHHDYINTSMELPRPVRKELWALSKATPAGYKKALNYRRFFNRKEKFFQMLAANDQFKKVAKPSIELLPGSKAAKVLRNMQLCEITILDEFVRICEKYNLKYYLYGGTLLGAVRHKGFIPWDDDMDIVMPRADFEKFRKLSKKELDKSFYFQTCFTDKNYPLLFAKLRKKNTYASEEKFKGKKMQQGIFIDIMPLDYFPDSKKWADVALHGVSFLHQVAAFKKCKSNNIMTHILFRLLKMLPRKFTYRLRDSLMKFCNRHSNHNKVCSFGSHYRPMIRRVLQAEWFGDGTELEFEGKKYNAPAQWEKYLLHLYGANYMELPPEEDRVCHSNIYETIVDEDEYLLKYGKK